MLLFKDKFGYLILIDVIGLYTTLIFHWSSIAFFGKYLFFALQEMYSPLCSFSGVYSAMIVNIFPSVLSCSNTFSSFWPVIIYEVIDMLECKLVFMKVSSFYLYQKKLNLCYWLKKWNGWRLGRARKIYYNQFLKSFLILSNLYCMTILLPKLMLLEEGWSQELDRLGWT